MKPSVILFGSSGTVGTHLVSALQSIHVDLCLVVRKETIKENSEKATKIKEWESKGAKLQFGDIMNDSVEDIKNYLTQSSCNIVVSCLGDTLIKEGQAKLIKAAIEVKTVKWFIPSEWAWDYTVIGKGCVVADLEDQKIEQREQLIEAVKVRPDFSYTFINAGLFTEFFINDFSGIYVKEKRMVVPDSLDVKLSLTSLSNTARYTAHLLSHGLTDEVKNKRIYFADETVTYRQAKDRLEKLTNSTFDVTICSLKELKETEQKLRNEGKMMEAWTFGFRILMVQQVGVAWDDEQTYNAKHFPTINDSIEQFAKTLLEK